MEEHEVRRAVVAGGGFIGLEIAENLHAKGIAVTVIDMAPQIMPNVLDPEIAAYAKRHLQKKGIRIQTGTALKAVLGGEKASGIQTDQGTIQSDMVVVSIGIRPNTAFLKDSGIKMDRGTIVVDGQMRTNLPDVYAAGDCVVVKNRITGKPQFGR